MSLDSRWHVLVRDTTSKNPDKWVTLSELDNYLNKDETERIIRVEELVGDYSTAKGTDIATDLATIWEDVYPKPDPDGRSISERMDIVDQQLFETQGVADKLAAFELRKDESFEILENKNIVNPQINETPVRAYFDIALAAPATKRIRISAITPGVAANSYNYGVVATADPSDVGILWSAHNLVVSVLKDGGDNITTTAYEVARLAAVTPDFVSNFIISFDDGTLITEDGDGAGVIIAANDGKFANGAGADHVLTSTGTEIDAAVNMYLSNKYDATAAPVATNDIDEGYVVGSKWFDTVSKEWYICTANTQDNATWANTTLEAGELGTAAVADIVNDLTTGGTTDALSAEQGKDLKTTLNTEAGYIDALQAVAPEYIATFATATAANMDLTVAATPEEGETVTIGTVVYKARRDVLSELGTKASGVLTLTANVAANDTVSIGTTGNEIVYKFVAEPVDPYDVDLGVDASTSIDNLIAAITFDDGLGTNEGSLYGTGTTAHPQVTAAAGAGETMDVTALSYGFAGNSINTTDPVDGGTAMAFGNVTLTGGIDPRADGDVYVNSSAEAFIDNLEKAIEATGTNGTDYYFTTPAARTDVEVSAQTESTLTITAKVKGAAGNSIALAETLSDVGSLWTGGAEFLSNGVDGTVGATGKVIFTADNAYFCTDGTKCTISDSAGWKTAEFL